MRWFTATILVLVLATPLALYGWLQRGKALEGKVLLRYMAWGTPQQQEGELLVLGKFQASHPGIFVECMFAPGQNYMEKLQLMLAAGTEPDVYRFIYSPFPQYAGLGYFAPLDDLIARDREFHLTDIVKPALEQMTIGGTIFGMNGIFSGRVVYYNKKLFAAAGLSDPHDLYLRGEWDYSHFLAAARAITVLDSHTGLPLRVGLSVDPQDLYWMLWGFGGDMMTANGRVVIDEPRSIEGMQFYADLEHRYHVIPQPSMAGIESFNFEAGNVGMMTEWVGAATRFRFIKSFDWDVVPIPAGPRGRVNLIGGNATVLSKHSAHPKEAWELLKFMTSAEAERTFCGDAVRRSIPTHVSLLNDPVFLHADQRPFHTDSYLAVYQHARRMPVTARWNDWQQDYVQWMDRMMTDDLGRRVSAEVAAKGLAKDIRESLARGEDD